MQRFEDRRTRQRVTLTVFAAVLCVLFVVAMIAVSWVGYITSDDRAYGDAAEAWLRHAPFLAGTHWGLRHFIVLPLAAAYAVFGRGDFALATPAFAYTAGLMIMMGLCVRHVAGTLAGILCPLLIASIPAIAVGATMVVSDNPEAFFVMASYWTFHFAHSSQRRRAFVFSGVLAGCGFLTRETTVALLVPYAILFVIGYGKRLGYIWMGIGFAAVVGADFCCLWVMSGDPFWRIHVTQHGLSNDNPSTPGFVAPAGSSDSLGVFALARPLQAGLLLFGNQSVGVMPWFGVPAALHLLLRPEQPGTARLVRLFVLLAVAWFGVLNFVFVMLWVLPRYQTVTFCALSVPASILLADWLRRGYVLRAASVLLPVMGVGIVLASAADHGIMFGERAFAAYVRQSGTPVATDPATLDSTKWFLENDRTTARATETIPPPGGLYFLNRTPRRGIPSDWPIQSVPANSTIVAHFVQERSVIARIGIALGLDRALPVVLWRKINPDRRQAEVIRMP